MMNSNKKFSRTVANDDDFDPDTGSWSKKVPAPGESKLDQSYVVSGHSLIRVTRKFALVGALVGLVVGVALGLAWAHGQELNRRDLCARLGGDYCQP